jgi:hypothetical protein
MLGTDVDAGVNRALFVFLLPELEEKFKSVMADLEEVRIATLFPTPVDGGITFRIVITHDGPALLNAWKGKQDLFDLTHLFSLKS